MVGWDMVTRLRPALGVLAAVALLALGGVSLAANEGTPPAGDRHEVVAVAKAPAGAAATTRTNRAPVPTLFALAGLVALASTGSARTSDLIGRQRRRPGDDGEDWRSLLLGAPPALA
jgi:hypothetical protein